MPEKHEFDVRTLRRGSQSSELERHSLPPDIYDSPRPSVSPPHIVYKMSILPVTQDTSRLQMTRQTNNSRPLQKSMILNIFRRDPRLRTIQTSKPRRYFSRTFPADSLTQPHLDQCYNRPYGFCLRTPLQEEHENTKSAQDLCLELDHLQKQIRYLKSAVIPVEKEFHSPAAQLPKYGNDDPQSEILIMAERERMISQRMQWLQNQLVIIWREVERTERAHKYTVEELTRVSDSNDRLAQPFRDMARAMNERNLGRRWLQGKIPWANAVHIGSEVPDFAMILTRERVMTEGL
ncbi:hypothetical protein H4I96_06877 [Botrytis cinerea]